MSSSGGQSNDDPLHVNRREVLKLSSLAALAGSAAELQGCDNDHRRPEETDRLRVVRDEDMALLEIGLVGMTRSGDDTVLSWSDNEVARIVVYLQPQHVLEGAYWTTGKQPMDPDDPVPTRLSGETRLVFQPPEVAGSIPFTLASLLSSLRRWIPVVDPRAEPPGDVTEPAPLPALPPTNSVGQTLSRLRQRRNAATSPAFLRLGQPSTGARPFSLSAQSWDRPTDDVTSIELPYRLQLSPNEYGRFLHPTEPVLGDDGSVGLWASRLAALGPHGQPADDRFDSLRTIRAIWARDFDLPSGRPVPGDAPVESVRTDPFETTAARPSLLVDGRTDIVLQSSYPNLRLNETRSTLSPPLPMRVDRLWLSALGGGLDLRGEWSVTYLPPPIDREINLVQWVHKATLGRDHYVEVQRQGILWPTGHRAVYAEVTERRVRPDNKAVLHKKGYILIGEVTKAWAPTTTGDDALWRQAPLRSVTFLDTVVPCDEIPNAADVDGLGIEQLVTLDTEPARARVLVEDRHGATHHTQMGFVFFTLPPDHRSGRVAELNAALVPAAELFLDNQRVAYADEGDPAGVRHETHSLTWEGVYLDGQMFPVCVEAALVVDAARSLLQNSDAGAAPIRMQLHDAYLSGGLGEANANQVLFGLAAGETALSLDFASDSRRSGGFVAPSFDIGGLSVLNGPIGGSAEAFAQGGFDPASFFEDAAPKLFGVLSLADLLEAVGAPTILSSGADALESLLSDVERFERLSRIALPGSLSTIQDTLDDAATHAVDALGYVADGDFESLKSALSDLDTQIRRLQSDLEGQPEATDPLLKPLQPILARLVGALGAAGPIIDGALALQNAIEKRQIKLSWEAPLKELEGLFFPGDPLVLEVVVNADTGGVDMTARLDNFELSLFGIVSLPVERFSFIQRTGSKPDIDVKLGSTEFMGMLKFMQTLIEILPVDGFSDPPAIEVDETGLLASLSLPLPNVSVGAFSIENMNLSAALEVPFIGKSILFTFGFCSRDNPFVLTVMCVGGGGFFSIEVTPNGLRMVETALEARASLGVDFGVASGSVSIAVGIYLNLHMPEPDTPKMLIEGYVKFRGEVSVLGIVSACLMLHLKLWYQSEGNKVIGEAEMTIEISILCFSTSVTVSCRRQFSGDNQDPTFLETMAPADPLQPMLGSGSIDAPWALYVNAFTI